MALTFENGWLGVLKEEDYPRVYDAILKVMDETGVAMLSEKARKILKSHGARVEGEVVHFPKILVEKALSSAPSEYTWLARNEERTVSVGNGSCLAVPALGPVYAEDMEKGRRRGTLEDFIITQKLYQAGDVIDAVGSNSLEPDDVDPYTRHLYMMYEILKNTDKPATSFLTITSNGVSQLLDMLEIAFGSKKVLEENHVTYTSVCPLSPLAWDEKALETMMISALRNQGVSFAAASMGGMTSPISVMGTAVQISAEILAGIVFTQLVGPGTPCIYGTSSGIGNMRYARYNCGSPLEKQTSMATVQIAREIFHLPNRCMSGLTEAQEVDVMCGLEVMQNTMISFFCGCDLNYESIGLKDAIMTVSFEKMIIDMEIIDRCRTMWQGIDTSDKALSVEAIQEVGIQGNYLMHPDTFAACRKLWYPSISNWDSYEDWQKKGSPTMLERANAKYKEMLANAPETYLDAELDKELQSYIKIASNDCH